MDKKSILRIIAENAYNIGFGAKKHFATYDIIDKASNFITFIVLSIGIFQLVFQKFEHNDIVSALLIIVSIISIYTSCFNNKEKYNEIGKELISLYYKLRDLYLKIKNNPENADLSSEYDEIKIIMDKFNNISLTKQIILSDWYAHYKFFWQTQTSWLNEELKFKFFRDKIPLSFLFISSIVIVFIIILRICL